MLGTVLGLCSVTYTTQNQTLRQLLSPPHLRGRVMSIYLLDRGLVPIGALVAGAVANEVGGGPNALRLMSMLALSVIVIVVVTRPAMLSLRVPVARSSRYDAAGGTRRPPRTAPPCPAPRGSPQSTRSRC